MQEAIGKEIKDLEQLTTAIDAANTDDEQPVDEAALSRDNKEEGAHASSGTVAEQVQLLLLTVTILMHGAWSPRSRSLHRKACYTSHQLL